MTGVPVLETAAPGFVMTHPGAETVATGAEMVASGAEMVGLGPLSVPHPLTPSPRCGEGGLEVRSREESHVAFRTHGDASATYSG